MATSDGRHLRDSAIWAIVIGGHLLLVVLLWRLERQPAPGDRTAIELFFVELSRPREEKQIERPTPSSSAPPARRAPPTPDMSVAPPAQDPAPPMIDWYGEAERAAREITEKGAQPGPRTFGDHPASPYRRCKLRKSSFEWDPEPDKFGIAGLLPFARLGERCILGLGFFGCGIGKLPEANGRLFDDMKDPLRPRSSVPDVDSCEP